MIRTTSATPGDREIVGRYVDVDGVRTYFESAGQGPGMLCLHTAGRDCRQWHPYMEHFSARFRVVALDMPGHQKSWPLPGHRCIDDADKYAEFIWRFKETIELIEPVVMGCSVGGNMVYLIAQKYAADVSGIVSFQGSAWSPRAASPTLLRHPQVAVGSYLYDRADGMIGSKATPETRAFVAWTALQMVPEAIYADLEVYGTFDVRERMTDITCPVLAIRGLDDWIVTQQMVDETVSLLSNASFVDVRLLPGAGHFSHMEVPTECIGLIEAFLARAMRRS